MCLVQIYVQNTVNLQNTKSTHKSHFYTEMAFYVYGHLPACVSAPLAYLLPMEARRENRILQD